MIERTFIPGTTYEVVFQDGSSKRFRYLDVDSDRRRLIEIPPGSGTTETFEALTEKGYQRVDIVDTPGAGS